MARLAETDRCTRCGARDDVRDVKYVRAGMHLTEPWCQPCRRAKLVRADKAGERNGRGLTTRAILALGGMGAVVLLVVRLLS